MSDDAPLPAGRTAERMPVLFVGHGSPMNAIEDNQWSRGFKSLAALLPTPRAIVSISAHWWMPGTFVTGNARPETIHDFGGFSPALYEMQYPAPGDEALARRIVTLLARSRAAIRLDWGLDHGTWSVLHHLRPAADVPVVQVSIDGRLSPEGHVALGQALSSLRDEGVLVMGSGNITHNLRHAMSAMGKRNVPSPTWASTFDASVARALEDHDLRYLSEALDRDEGRLSHPTPDHYFPLLYVAGAAGATDPVSFPVTGFDLSSVSMRSVVIG